MAGAEAGRGTLTVATDRVEITALVDEAIAAGCRKDQACEAFGVKLRTIQRWKLTVCDGRNGPLTAPKNKLTIIEQEVIIKTAVSAEFVNLSPHQIVPKLADAGIYLASESTFYRLLNAKKLNAHRGLSKPRLVERPRAFAASAPNQIYSWDITYLQTSVRGQFYYLYLFLDIFSRKIVGWKIHETQEAHLSSELLESICIKEKIDKMKLVLHADNGGPMKGATMQATMQRLGVMPSFSRAHVSDDNPFSESLFKTIKYCPIFPTKPFASLEVANDWMQKFETWYNTEHLHSGINFVTPQSKHLGLDINILKNRNEIYELAKLRNPERWTGETRNWDAVTTVNLNPLKEKNKSATKEKYQLVS